MLRFYSTAIKGDLCNRLPELLQMCGLSSDEPRIMTDWESILQLMDSPNFLCLALSGDWTVVIDNGQLTTELIDHPDHATSLANHFGTTVVCAFGDSGSGVCGFRVHDSEVTRSVFVTPEEIMEDEGEPLAGEEPVDENYSEEDVLATLELLGIDIESGVENSNRFACVQLKTRG